MRLWTFLFLIILTSQNAVALNILGIFSLPLRSHYMAVKPFFRELANRGHNVTILNNFPDEEPQQNLRFIDLQGDRYFKATIATLDAYENSDSRTWEIENYWKHMILPIILNIPDCDNLFINENAINHLAEGMKYDLIFVEQFMSDCGLAYAAALYDAPFIGITSHVLLPWALPRLGLPFSLDDPFYFVMAGPHKSLMQKVQIYVMNAVFNTVSRWNIQHRMEEVFTHHLNRSVSIEREARMRLTMMFAYQHYSVSGSRLLAPQLIEIAGIHIGDSKSVPKDIEKFLATADHGAIYFSFGSNLKSSSMSEKKLNEFLKAFKRIPQKVLWKWENDTFPEGHDNIYAKKWFPQLDVLCHPKVLAFISHGGMLSLSESVHCGKPLLVSPFFGDQYTNAESITNGGFGKYIMFDRINADNLVEALKELTSEKMQQNAKKTSELWHDRPQKVMDSAIYWTEYVARHKTAPPSLIRNNSSTFRSLHLDVYAVLILLVASFLGLIYLIAKLFKFIIVTLFGKLFRKKKLKAH